MELKKIQGSLGGKGERRGTGETGIATVTLLGPVIFRDRGKVAELPT